MISKNMKIRIAGYEKESIVDGPGMRLVIFAQGCPHKCDGCHNPGTHPFDGGYEADTDDFIPMMRGNPLLSGLTLSGGEPFAQAKACAELARSAKAAGLDVWVFSGYTLEELFGSGRADFAELLGACDTLVDGRFEKDKRTLEISFVGSKNQRVIDLKSALKEF